MLNRKWLAIVGVAGLACSAIAQQATKSVVVDEWGTTHTTTEAILDERHIAVPGSVEKLVTWTQVGAGGVRTPYYSISLDGQQSDVITSTSYDIKLRYAEFDPATRTPQVAGALRNDSTNIRIVQFVTQPLDVFRAQIEAMGGTFHRYLANHAYIVELPPSAQAKVAALPYVRWTGPFHPAYRLDEGILASIKSGNFGEAGLQAFNIECFARGPEAQQKVAQAVVAMGGNVQAFNPDGVRMEVWVDPARLMELARMDEVHWIDPWGPGGTDMDICRQLNGAVPTLSGINVLGQGVRGEVFDTGVRTTHQAFQTPGVLIHGANGGDTSHGTNTYGIVFGNGAANASGTGMLPNREQGIFAVYTQVTQFGGAKTRLLHTQELVNPALNFKAVFQSNSVGSTQVTSYTSVSQEMDDIIFQTDLLICQSQSNLNSQNSRPQAWAKNIVAVGGVNHNNTLTRNDDGQSGASYGPAADGRVKPELANVYDSILCTSNSSDTSYTTGFGGTSGATPITAGAFGLLFQLWHNGTWAGHGGGASVFDSRPHSTTARALMINTAYKYAIGTISRARQGWGMPDLTKLYNDRAKTFIVDEDVVLTNLDTQKYRIGVAPGTTEFRVTLVYLDPGGTTSSTQHRINDLSLKVTAPDGTIYYGNNGLTTANVSTSGGAKDTKNTVENVFLTNPTAATNWFVEVSADQLNADSHTETPGVDADYALVIYGASRVRILP